jgi:hypothetical protein
MEGVYRAMRFAAVVVMLAFLAAAGQRRLTPREAERLARAALSGRPGDPPGFSLESPPVPPKKGAMFEVLWADPPSDETRLRTILVDIDTGDVWDGVRCELVTTPALETLQRTIRRQLKINARSADRARAVAKENGCSNLVDNRPKREDFGVALLARISANKSRSSYRYVIVQSDQQFAGTSPFRLAVREGSKIRFLITARSMYIIDENGAMQELNGESRVEP